MEECGKDAMDSMRGRGERGGKSVHRKREERVLCEGKVLEEERKRKGNAERGEKGNGGATHLLIRWLI